MDALQYIQENTIKFYDNKGMYPNERTYKSYKAALLGGIFYHELAWYKNTVLYDGMTPFEFRNKFGGTKDFFTIPLFKPEFLRHKDD